MATTVRNQQAVQIGEAIIPLGKITTSFIRWSESDEEIPVVRIHTEGGMDLGDKDVILDFEFETIAKTHRFFHALLAQTGASFNLPARSMSPTITCKEGMIEGVLDVKFSKKQECEAFNDTVASVFFPKFQKQIVGDATARLTLQETTENAAIEMMNEAFERLNQKTHNYVSGLLTRNGDLRFYVSKSQELDRSGLSQRQPYYFVDPEGVVRKEKGCFGSAPKGHRLQWDESPAYYYRLRTLRQPEDTTQEEILTELREALEFGKVLCKQSLVIGQKIEGDLARIEAELNQKSPRTALQWELLRNFLASPKTPLSSEERGIIYRS